MNYLKTFLRYLNSSINMVLSKYLKILKLALGLHGSSIMRKKTGKGWMEVGKEPWGQTGGTLPTTLRSLCFVHTQ